MPVAQPPQPPQPPRTDSWRFIPNEASGNERSANCPWRSHRSHRSHRGHKAGVSLQVKRVATSAPRLARGGLPAKKQPPYWATAFKCWRKPIFPDRLQSSIFGAGELNFRVRDGNGWTLTVINTNLETKSLSFPLLLPQFVTREAFFVLPFGW